ncbi:[protein-PII] uridylyltransferase family protein [Pseudaestuariivita sp.]|uniref:[protein-PII] uridylyltransferase family protein n=1 Tax=Pseudaestuariivita sp. TaxID=2211669 RepID=UPI00405877B8
MPTLQLLTGAAGSAPYLADLIVKEQAWLETAAADITEARDALVAETHALPPNADPSKDLRRLKRRCALLVALADLAGLWTLEEVTGALTDFADAATEAALRYGLRRLPEDVPVPTVFAMGKMGAGELNYSSDIDLICLFDDSGMDLVDIAEARRKLARAVRQMTAILNDVTSEGYVFRTDLRLRPDAGTTPVCIAMGAAEQYYETLGRTWERAAWVKARPAAGDLAAGESFITALRPFIWRRHLDFAAIEDAHNMRLAIREAKGLFGPITLPGHNLKLGRGGIREIEFFTQTRQIISGGRDASLRLRGTVPALARLATQGWVDQDTAETLTRHYRTLREVEHRVQMLRDAQTHDLPKTDAGFDRLAAFMDTDTDALKRHLTETLEEVHACTETFFDPPRSKSAAATSKVDESWLKYPALRSDRAAAIFRRLQPEILARLEAAPRPDEARAAFDRFLAGLPAGVQLFSLFDANPQLIDLLVETVSIGPELATYLSRNAHVFDAVIAGAFFAPWPGEAALSAELAGLLAREEDYEAQLDTARRWSKDWQFRVGVHLLRGITPPEEAASHYAALARAILAALWPVVTAQFAAKHGPLPGRGAVVLGMGSLGAGQLTARSDLDLIVIYDPQDAAMSEGPRPLAVRPYYARLTQALVTALTAPMSEGRLFEVDMRLRPSGNQGPVATSWAAFQDYQQSEAWTWEHMALTRAAVVAGEAQLGADLTAFLEALLGKARAAGLVLRDLADMRARIFEARASRAAWDAKLGPGRSQDIELFAQAALLVAGEEGPGVEAGLAAAASLGWVTEAEAGQIVGAYRLCWALRMAGQLIGKGDLDAEALGEAGTAFVLRLTGCDARMDLDATLAARTTRAAEIISRVLDEGRDT